jgi:hypothetical protein
MGDIGSCWVNTVVERFFGSLKHDWLFKVHQPTREHMKEDVSAYMRYYNLERLHSANNDISPVNCEISLRKESGWSCQEQTIIGVPCAMFHHYLKIIREMNTVTVSKLYPPICIIIPQEFDQCNQSSLESAW